MPGKPTGNEWMELNIYAILNTNCTPTTLSTQEVSLLLDFHSYSVITLRWLYTHGKTSTDTRHPLTNNTMLTHLVQLANLWMDWFFISLHTAKCKELKANFIAQTNFI